MWRRDGEGRELGGSWRPIFFVKPLWTYPWRSGEAQGWPTSGKVCPPKALRKPDLLVLSTLQAPKIRM